MELEVSAWTRRDRLERIAAAERDRRAGRTALALAALGEGSEWPARLVLALAKLPDGEGPDARKILEATLDDWAAESGLAALDPQAAAPAVAPVDRAEPLDEDERVAIEDDLVVDAVDALEEDLLVPATPVAASRAFEARDSEDRSEPRAPVAPSEVSSVSDRLVAPIGEADVSDALAKPIEFDELERAFAEAEAQTDEMHGVNEVAERVLMDEPLGLAELDGQIHHAAEDASVGGDHEDDGLADEVRSPGVETDAAWAEAPIWPEPIEPEPPRIAASSASLPEVETRDVDGGRPTRTEVIATLERWLDNLRVGSAR